MKRATASNEAVARVLVVNPMKFIFCAFLVHIEGSRVLCLLG